MKRNRSSRAAVLLAALLLVLPGVLPGCLRFEQVTDGPSGDPDPVPVLPDGGSDDGDLSGLLTRENLAEANGTVRLLFTYGGFRVREMSYLDGELSNSSESYFLVDDPGILSVTEGQAVDGQGQPYTYTNYSFWDGSCTLYASVKGEGVSASVYADPYSREQDAENYPGDLQFFYDFYDAPVEILSADADTVTFRTAPEILEGGILLYTVIRESLAVLSLERYGADGVLIYSRTAEYGRDRVSDFMAPLREDVSDQRIVRLNVVWYDNEVSTSYMLFLHLPREWQLTVIGSGGLLYLYEQENMSVPADNPIPPGKDDLTVWGTNAAG